MLRGSIHDDVRAPAIPRLCIDKRLEQRGAKKKTLGYPGCDGERAATVLYATHGDDVAAAACASIPHRRLAHNADVADVYFCTGYRRASGNVLRLRRCGTSMFISRALLKLS